jgi:uncharacterized protein (TIGR00375 family)
MLMTVIADLHIHSRFAMACSKNITIRGLEEAAVMKGIKLLGTGDFTHNQWMAEMKTVLEEDGNGLYRVSGSNSGVRFVPSTEISTVYEKDGKFRKIHTCVLSSSIEAAESINDSIKNSGKLDSDGRPTLSISAAELLDRIFKSDSRAFVFPAHIWTPYFGVFGSISGFDTLEAAYEDNTKHIFALETGLSSDTLMNWRLSSLDKYALISNSDMHSLQKMGREANIFDFGVKALSYSGLTDALITKDDRFVGTIEFYPEEGKYHYDGHGRCAFSVNPETSKITRCPKCGKPLVVGVLHRVDSLADRPSGYKPKGNKNYSYLVPLIEIIAYATHKSEYSPVTRATYSNIISSLGDEFTVLQSIPFDEIAKCSTPEIAECIKSVREGRVSIKPGYDGVFGEINLMGKPFEQLPNRQKSIADF